MRKIPVFIIITILYSFNAFAMFEKGGVLIQGAAPSSMGGAYTALAKDIHAIYYNSGGLYQSKTLNISAMYGSLVNTKQTEISFAASNYFAPYFVMGVSAERLGSSFASLAGLEGARSFEDIYSVSLSMPFLSDVEREFGAGLRVKYLYAEYSDSASTLGLDFGFLYKINNVLMAESLNIGFTIQDIQSKIRWSSGREEEISSAYKFGVAYVFSDDLNICFDMDVVSEAGSGNDSSLYLKFGAEKKFAFLALRIGASGFNTVSPVLTAGVGISAGMFDVNYSFMNHSDDLGSTHRFDLITRIGVLEKDYVPPPQRIQIFSGNNNAYIKWVSALGSPEKYKVYISSDLGEKYVRESQGGSMVNFLIEGLNNGTIYRISISSVLRGQESEKSREFVVVPEAIPGEIKQFYKKAKLLYIEKRYTEALDELRKITGKDAEHAEIVMLKERIEKIVKNIK